MIGEQVDSPASDLTASPVYTAMRAPGKCSRRNLMWISARQTISPGSAVAWRADYVSSAPLGGREPAVTSAICLGVARVAFLP